MMRKLLWISGLAAAVAFAGVGAAGAADMPIKAPPLVAPGYSWTGIYFGVGDGFQWQHMNWAFDPSNPTNPNQAFSVGRESNIFSGYVGAQLQFGHVVIGAEYDRFGSFGRSDLSTQTPCFAATVSCAGRIGDLQEAGGRIGWAGSGFIPLAQDWLIYATGGWARGNVTTEFLTVAPAPASGFGTEVAQNGWYAGVGIDFVLARGSLVDWVGGIQYQHVDLGTAFHCAVAGSCAPGLNADNRDVAFTDDIFQFRTSLRFH